MLAIGLSLKKVAHSMSDRFFNQNTILKIIKPRTRIESFLKLGEDHHQQFFLVVENL